MGTLVQLFVVVYYIVVIMAMPLLWAYQVMLNFKASPSVGEFLIALFFIAGWSITIKELLRGVMFMVLSAKTPVKEEGETKVDARTESDDTSRR